MGIEAVHWILCLREVLMLIANLRVGREGSPHTVGVHVCIYVISWILKSKEFLTTFVLSHFMPVDH